MPRKPREPLAGGIYHVFARGNDRQDVFRDDLDRATYIRMLSDVTGSQGWHCLTYCLMTTHLHLLVETPAPNLAAGMQRLQGGYARKFNLRHRRSGHLFQERYGCKRVEDDAQLWMTVGYIVRNPVEARICARLDEWPWSSHAAMTADGRAGWVAADRLLDYLGSIGGGGEAMKHYAQCVGGE